MSKTLLSESEIKKFMKHANLGIDATNNFFGRLNEHSLAEAEGDEPEEDEEGLEGEEGPADALPDEPDTEEAPPVEEPGAAGEDEAMEAAVETVVSAIVDALKEVPGAPDVSLDHGPEGALPGEEVGLPGEEGEEVEVPGGELGLPGGEAGLPPGPEEEEEGPEAALMEYLENADFYMNEDDDGLEEELYEEDEPVEEEIVNEVTRRVAARILKVRGRSRKRPRRRRR